MTTGIHHVTAFSGPAHRNLRFYTDTLGLRLVKKTVNFDDPGTYHLYYGDEPGRPGSILTFFPWEHAAPGTIGSGETREVAFRVPLASIGFWTQRFVAASVPHESPRTRFGETVLAFHDPDGLPLVLVGIEGIEREAAWSIDGIAPAHAIRGLHGITLQVRDTGPTAAVLKGVFGFAEVGREGRVIRYMGEAKGLGQIVDLVEGAGGRGRQGAGSVHHVAFRAADDAEQASMVKRLADLFGIRTTPQLDRAYFRSVYFREPGGVLFEIATDEPGFATDEPADSLGARLMLPTFLEGRRAAIEAELPQLA
jgi:glyoxalase family protein